MQGRQVRVFREQEKPGQCHSTNKTPFPCYLARKKQVPPHVTVLPTWLEARALTALGGRVPAEPGCPQTSAPAESFPCPCVFKTIFSLDPCYPFYSWFIFSPYSECSQTFQITAAHKFASFPPYCLLYLGFALWAVIRRNLFIL